MAQYYDVALRRAQPGGHLPGRFGPNGKLSYRQHSFGPLEFGNVQAAVCDQDMRQEAIGGRNVRAFPPVFRRIADNAGAQRRGYARPAESRGIDGQRTDH